MRLIHVAQRNFSSPPNRLFVVCDSEPFGGLELVVHHEARTFM
jgi:hypothetical protein